MGSRKLFLLDVKAFWFTRASGIEDLLLSFPPLDPPPPLYSSRASLYLVAGDRSLGERLDSPESY